MSNKKSLASRPHRSAVRAAAIETLENRQLMSASFKIGIGVNDGSTSFMNVATSKLKSLGVQTVRLYASPDFNKRSWDGVLDRAIDYSNAGFDVTLTVNPKNGNVYSAGAVGGWFDWALSNSSLKNAVDRWEIGNEPDHSEYWKGSLSSYVSNLLKPAYESLHADGETVASAGPSWNPDDVQTMIDSGLLNYTDYVGFHPYANGADAVIKSLSDIKAVVAGRKPLIATEWNVRGLEGNASAWAAADRSVFSAIQSTFAINYYYAAEKVNTPAGPAGIMYKNGSPNQPFYDMFASFRGIAGVTVPTGSISSGSAGNGNTAAGGSGSIAGSVFNDDNADGVWNGSENASGVRTVFLDTNGNGKLDGGEKSVQSASNGTFKFTGLAAGTYKVSRVFPGGYHLSNFANDVTIKVNAGQQVTGANLGSTSSSKPGSIPAPTSGANNGSGIGSGTAAGTGQIAGTLWNDTDGDGKWDNGESRTASRTVFIDSNANGKLDSGEVSTTSSSSGTYSFGGLFAGTYNIAREFPSGYTLSNSATKDIVVTLATGQSLTGINLGSRQV